jgi:hypothetical protein
LFIGKRQETKEEEAMRDKTIGHESSSVFGDNVILGILLAAVVAAVLLFGSRFFMSDQSSTDVGVSPPSTEAPATGNTQPPQP